MAIRVNRVRVRSLISRRYNIVRYRCGGGKRRTAASALMAVVVFQATAQSVNEPSSQSATNVPPVLSEIVVTAEKRSESASDVPMSITALTGTELAQQG